MEDDRAKRDAAAGALPGKLETALGSHYSGDHTALLSLLDPHAVAMDGWGRVFASVEELRESFEARGEAPSLLMREARFALAGPSAPNAATVVGTFRLYTGPRETCLAATVQRATACFARGPQGWSAFHLHISPERSEEVDAAAFPLGIGKETYRYVRSILRTGQRAGALPTRVMLGPVGDQLLIDPGDVLYVEAKGKNSLVHASGGSFSVRMLLSEVQEQLPGSFVRAHRGFLVSTARITGMRRFELVLTDGTEIPVPARRYAEVRREIALRVTGGFER